MGPSWSPPCASSPCSRLRWRTEGPPRTVATASPSSTRRWRTRPPSRPGTGTGATSLEAYERAFRAHARHAAQVLLVAAGILREEERRFLWVFSHRAYPQVSGREENNVSGHQSFQRKVFALHRHDHAIHRRH